MVLQEKTYFSWLFSSFSSRLSLPLEVFTFLLAACTARLSQVLRLEWLLTSQPAL